MSKEQKKERNYTKEMHDRVLPVVHTLFAELGKNVESLKIGPRGIEGYPTHEEVEKANNDFVSNVMVPEMRKAELTQRDINFTIRYMQEALDTLMTAFETHVNDNLVLLQTLVYKKDKDAITLNDLDEMLKRYAKENGGAYKEWVKKEGLSGEADAIDGIVSGDKI